MQQTAQQLAICQAVATGTTHLLCDAVAGAGKTTTALQALHGAKGKVGFTAFNKHIADHLQTKLGSRASACTMHSLGFAAIRRRCETRLEQDKAKILLAQVWPEAVRGKKHFTESGKAVMALASAAKLNYLQKWDTDAYLEVADHHDIELGSDPERIFTKTTELLFLCLERTETIDFDDMIWLPVMKNWHPARFDLLVVDEVQDLSRLTQELAIRAASGGRMLAIGDPHQAIMGFAGADCESMSRLQDRMAASARSGLTLPLSTTFRCPTAHVELAQTLVPHITARPDALPGTVAVLGLTEIAKLAKPPDLIISRRNKMLTGLAFKLILQGVPCLVRGRDIGKGLLDLVYRLRPDDLDDLLAKLDSYRLKEVACLDRRCASESAYQHLEDRVGTLEEIAKQSQTVAQVEDFLRNIFSDDSNAAKVTLSSIHRAKGLEADTVFILDTAKLPLEHPRQKPWEKVQENNLAYVAMTRAKQALYFAEAPPAFLASRFVTVPPPQQ